MNKTFPEIIKDLMAKEQSQEEYQDELPEPTFLNNPSQAPQEYQVIIVKGRIVYRKGPGAPTKYPRYTAKQIDDKIEEL